MSQSTPVADERPGELQEGVVMNPTKSAAAVAAEAHQAAYVPPARRLEAGWHLLRASSLINENYRSHTQDLCLYPDVSKRKVKVRVAGSKFTSVCTHSSTCTYSQCHPTGVVLIAVHFFKGALEDKPA